MKIAYIVGVISMGGGKTHVEEVIKNLRHQHTVFVFTPSNSETKMNVITIPLIPSIHSYHFHYLLFMLFSLLIHLFYVLKNKIEIIYCRGFSPSCYIIGKLTGRKVITEVNGILEDESKIAGGKQSSIGGLFEGLSYRLSSKIIAVTQSIKDYIPNGVNIELFKPMNRDVKNELYIDQNYYHICFVGIFAHWQGIEFLIQSAPLILKEISNTRFLIVGDGIMKETLIKMIKEMGLEDNFILTGPVPYREVPKNINVSDVCVVPKRPLKSGYSPLKLYEYMACGKPVVASRLSGFEILEENNAGILVEPENIEELAKAIIKLLKDEQLREEMGKNGREYVVKNHSWESVARRVAEVCESTIREHKK